MKLKLTQTELLNLIQDNVSSRIKEVEIADSNPTYAPVPAMGAAFDAQARVIAGEVRTARYDSRNINRIAVIKAVRTMTGLGLREAKILVEVLIEGSSSSLLN